MAKLLMGIRVREILPVEDNTSKWPLAQHDALSPATGHAATRHDYLASARSTQSNTTTLDVYKYPPLFNAELVFKDGMHIIYSFSIECGGASLVIGRGAVVLG